MHIPSGQTEEERILPFADACSEEQTAPLDYERLLDWLEQTETSNGFYLFGL